MTIWLSDLGWMAICLDENSYMMERTEKGTVEKPIVYRSHHPNIIAYLHWYIHRT